MQDVHQPLGCDDGSLKPSHALYKWSNFWTKACASLNRPVDVAGDHKKRMEAAGFVDVHEVVHKWPHNQWAKNPKYKEIGAWTMMNMLQGVHGLTMAPFTRGLGWTTEEVETFLVQVRKDVKDKNIHCYWPM